MKRNSLFIWGVALATSGLFSSCGGGEDPQVKLVEAITPSSFSYVVDSDGVGRVFAGPTYRVTFDDDKKTASISMENVRWDDDMQPASFGYSDVAWKFNPANDARVIDADMVLPDANGEPEITDLDVVMYDPVECGNGLLLTGLSVSYTAPGNYRVTNVPYRTIFIGSTETVDGRDNTSFVSTDIIYSVDIDPNRLVAAMKMQNVAFAEGMPIIAMELGQLTVIPVDGGYELLGSDIVPSVSGTPYEQFKVTGLHMKVNLQGESELAFDCMGDTYHVTAYFEATYGDGN